MSFTKYNFISILLNSVKYTNHLTYAGILRREPKVLLFGLTKVLYMYCITSAITNVRISILCASFSKYLWLQTFFKYNTNSILLDTYRTRHWDQFTVSHMLLLNDCNFLLILVNNIVHGKSEYIQVIYTPFVLSFTIQS